MTSIGINATTQITPDAMKSDQPIVSQSGPENTPPKSSAITCPETMISVTPVAVNAMSVTVIRRWAYATTGGLLVRSASTFQTAVTMMLPRKRTTPRMCSESHASRLIGSATLARWCRRATREVRAIRGP
jgi:hypothetical protein